ncbi:MAG: hypothetical protein ACTHJM_14280 [Marmoricola sp.]
MAHRVTPNGLAESTVLRDNRRVGEVDGAQVWAMIGVFSTLMFTALGLFAKTLKSDIGALRSEMGALRSEMNGRFDVVGARFTDVEHRMESIETDMHLVKAHLIGQRSA